MNSSVNNLENAINHQSLTGDNLVVFDDCNVYLNNFTEYQNFNLPKVTENICDITLIIVRSLGIKK